MKLVKDRKLLNIELGRITPEEYRKRPETGAVVVLDNIRSAHNVGSAFRTCDSFGMDKLWLCGICAVPPSAEIHKTGLGAEDSVPWEYCPNTLDVLGRFVPEKDAKYAFVFGNEVDGVGQEAVDMSDFALEIPQYGTKHSLNVSVSIGVVLWHYRLNKA